jgi:uncharacterized peroxidase-related enzyme
MIATQRGQGYNNWDAPPWLPELWRCNRNSTVNKNDRQIAEIRDTEPIAIKAKIRIIEEHEATGDLGRAYKFVRATAGLVPGIIKCFGARPDFLTGLMDLALKIHFSDGHLCRRHKEMIASYVSFLNRCPYWLDSHSYCLRVQGANNECVAAIFEGRIDEAGLTRAERALMDYAKLITEASYRSTAEDVQKLRDNGWNDDQISEAVYIIGIFAFFNRVADAFGLPSQNYLGMALPQDSTSG